MDVTGICQTLKRGDLIFTEKFWRLTESSDRSDIPDHDISCAALGKTLVKMKTLLPDGTAAPFVACGDGRKCGF